MEDAPKETRRNVIMIKYNNLMKKIKELDFVKEDSLSIVPEITRDNLGDVMFFFKFAFTNPADGFRENMKTIMSLQSKETYTDEQFEQLFQLVSPFLLFLSDFC